MTRGNITAFISYCWESEAHKLWVHNFSESLCADGVSVCLDQWETVPGDQLPEFMERALRQNRFVLIICTPCYMKKANQRTGGVGYEGTIMTAEVMEKRNDRKFIPILREGEWQDAAATWLAGKYYIDLRGNPYSRSEYVNLLRTLHGQREQTPPIRQIVVPTSAAILDENAEPDTVPGAINSHNVRINDIYACDPPHLIVEPSLIRGVYNRAITNVDLLERFFLGFSSKITKPIIRLYGNFTALSTDRSKESSRSDYDQLILSEVNLIERCIRNGYEVRVCASLDIQRILQTWTSKPRLISRIIAMVEQTHKLETRFRNLKVVVDFGHHSNVSFILGEYLLVESLVSVHEEGYTITSYDNNLQRIIYEIQHFDRIFTSASHDEMAIRRQLNIGSAAQYLAVVANSRLKRAFPHDEAEVILG